MQAWDKLEIVQYCFLLQYIGYFLAEEILKSIILTILRMCSSS